MASFDLKNKHFLALLGNGVISVFSVLTIFVLYRALSKTDAGTWFFFLTVLGLADSIRNGFLTTATIKFYAGTNPERGKEVLGSVWYLAIVITIIMIGINLLAIPFMGYINKPEVLIVIKWFSITLISTLPISISGWVLIADENYSKMLLIRFVNNGTMILLILLLIFFKIGSLRNILIVNLATNLLASLLCIIQGLAKLTTIPHRTKKTIIELSHFGKYSLATNTSANLLTSANTFIITWVLGPAALAVYNLPQRLMEFVEIPLRSFMGTGLSAMAAAQNSGNTEKIVFITKKYAGMLTMAFIPMAIIAFFGADIATQLLGGGKYAGTEAANIFRMLMFIAILYPIDRFNGATLDIINQPKVNFHKVLVMMVVNISVSMVGVYSLKNLYGVAIATPCTLLAGLIFGYFNLKKHLPNYTFIGIIQTGFIESKSVVFNFLNRSKTKHQA